MESEAQSVKTRRDRPAGVSNVAIWLILSGVITLLFYGVPLIARFSKGSSFSLGVASDILALLLAVMALVLARSLWKLKPWAVPWTIGLLTINVLSRVVSVILLHTTSNIVVQLLAVALNIWIIYYLATSKKVREAFQVA